MEQPIVALGVEQPFLIEPRLLELMVHIGSDDEIILALHQFEQIVINGFWCRHIHVGEAIFLDEISEMLLKPLARISEACRGG